MKYTDYYVSRWLHAEDLPSSGINITITKIFNESVGRPTMKEDKPIISSAELDQDWIPNKRQWRALWQLLGGNDKSTWIDAERMFVGKRVKLIPVMYNDKGDLTIRVEPADALKRQLPSRMHESAPDVMRSSLDDDDERRETANISNNGGDELQC
jgi:hypothetical protein